MHHILVVEDEPVIRNALRKLLVRHNYQVTEAESVEAVQALDDYQFSLVISDLRLPQAPGTDLISLVAPTPVLIMTSYASLRSAVGAMKQGAVDYIAKPFSHEEMIQRVESIISEHQDTPAPPQAPSTLSLDEYFVHFVEEHQHEMTETELARKLGISRKSLWERRQRFNLARPPKNRDE